MIGDSFHTKDKRRKYIERRAGHANTKNNNLDSTQTD